MKLEAEKAVVSAENAKAENEEQRVVELQVRWCGAGPGRVMPRTGGRGGGVRGKGRVVGRRGKWGYNLAQSQRVWTSPTLRRR